MKKDWRHRFFGFAFLLAPLTLISVSFLLQGLVPDNGFGPPIMLGWVDAVTGDSTPTPLHPGALLDPSFSFETPANGLLVHWLVVAVVIACGVLATVLYMISCATEVSAIFLKAVLSSKALCSVISATPYLLGLLASNHHQLGLWRMAICLPVVFLLIYCALVIGEKALAPGGVDGPNPTPRVVIAFVCLLVLSGGIIVAGRELLYGLGHTLGSWHLLGRVALGLSLLTAVVYLIASHRNGIYQQEPVGWRLKLSAWVSPVLSQSLTTLPLLFSSATKTDLWFLLVFVVLLYIFPVYIAVSNTVGPNDSYRFPALRGIMKRDGKTKPSDPEKRWGRG